jgi:hypothetical protein
MQEESMKRTIAITLGLGGVAAAAFLWLRHDNAAVEVAQAPLSPFIPSSPKLVAAGEELKDRAHSFVAADNGFIAEGVKVGSDGTVTFAAQKDGTSIVQTPLGARIVDKDKVVEEFAANIGAGVLKDDKESSSVVFQDRLGSVDLEYRYDGVQMEEFFHVDTELAGKLAASGHDLELSSKFPSLNESSGAVLLDDRTGAPLFLATADADGAMKVGKVEHLGAARVRMSNDVEFMLPASVAIDAKGERKELKRHFEVQEGALVATTVLDHAWLKTATAPIAIDPSVIEVGAVDISNFNGATNVVRDSAGTIHVVYKQGSRLRYARGDGNSFQIVATIDPGDVCRVDDRHPALVIDSADTLHLVFTSNINNTIPPGNNTTSRFACVRYAVPNSVGVNVLRVLHSSCPNRCQGTPESLAPWSKPLGVTYGHRAAVPLDRPGLIQQTTDGNGTPVFETFGNLVCNTDDRNRNFYVNTVVVDRSDRLHIGMMKHHDWAFNSFMVTRNTDGTYVRASTEIAQCTGAFAQTANPIHGLDELSVNIDREGNVIQFSVPENFHVHHGNIAFAVASQTAPARAEVKIFNPDTRTFIHNSSNSENPSLEFDPRKPSTNAPAETTVPQYAIDTRSAQRDRNGVIHVFYTIRPVLDDPNPPADWCSNIPKLRHAYFDTRVTPPRWEIESPFSSHTACGLGEYDVKSYYTKSNKVRLFFTQCVTTPGTGTIAHDRLVNGCTTYFSEATADGPMAAAQRSIPVELESHFQGNPIGQPFPATAQMIDDYEMVYLQRKRNVNTLLFFKSAPDVDAVRQVGPANHSWVGVAQPVFEFAPVIRDQANGVFRYKLEVSTSPSFATLAYTVDNLITADGQFGEPIRHTVDAPGLTDTVAGGIYYWRVVPRQGVSGTPETNFAGIREIGVDLRAPQAFSLIRPGCPVNAAGEKIDPACDAAPGANPTFEWQAANDE